MFSWVVVWCDEIRCLKICDASYAASSVRSTSLRTLFAARNRRLTELCGGVAGGHCVLNESSRPTDVTSLPGVRSASIPLGDGIATIGAGEDILGDEPITSWQGDANDASIADIEIQRKRGGMGSGGRERERWKEEGGAETMCEMGGKGEREGGEGEGEREGGEGEGEREGGEGEGEREGGEGGVCFLERGFFLWRGVSMKKKMGPFFIKTN